jgi:hypothetical protein
MAFTTITITGGPFLRPDGQPAQGTLTATLSERLQNGAEILDPTHRHSDGRCQRSALHRRRLRRRRLDPQDLQRKEAGLMGATNIGNIACHYKITDTRI